jgi:FAD/FMN-containing dehydrogenase
VCDHARLPRPLAGEHGAYLLLECASPVADPTGQLVDALARLDATAVGADLWAYRERHTEAINARGVPHKLDVAMPLGRLAEFELRVRDAVGERGEVYLFGHLGEGNVHVNVVGPAPDDERVDDDVLALVVEMGGSISAEHGVGVAKRRWLPRVRGAADLAAMRAVKRALDPSGLLNPGVLFDQA